MFCYDCKVYINHTDAGGIVYHANHLTFFENCRREWLGSMGFGSYFLTLDEDTLHFVVSHAELTYHAPLLVDDALSVTIDKVIQKPASLILHQSIYRKQPIPQKASSAIITLACVKNSSNGIRPTRLPAAFLDKLVVS
ncbi:MAG: thioesterase family protein [Moraxella sp.]|nr:thioesterase family protein [Moraxella sp.]